MSDRPPDERDEVNDRPTVMVPKFLRDGEVVEWMEVDAEWDEFRQEVLDVHDQVAETYANEPGVVSIGVARGERTTAGWSTSRIRIVVADEEVADAFSVPDEIDGIPLTVETGEILDSA